MATIKRIVDDLEPDRDEAAETHRFSVDGDQYEIDLVKANHELLLKALKPFMKAGRQRGAAGTREATAPRSDPKPSTEDKRTASEKWPRIYEWGRLNGFVASGHPNRSHIDAYEKARDAGTLNLP